jgi:hypothetical protein
MTYADFQKIADFHEKAAQLLGWEKRRGDEEKQRLARIEWHRAVAKKLRETAEAVAVAFPEWKTPAPCEMCARTGNADPSLFP